MSDYDSMTTDADSDRAFDMDEARHDREGHATASDPADCLKCQSQAEEAEGDECEGHPAGPFDPMGETVYCDGTCR